MPDRLGTMRGNGILANAHRQTCSIF
jgi:hypothetical protein